MPDGATSSARSRCCATCRARRPSAPPRRRSSTRSTARTSSPRVPATRPCARPARRSSSSASARLLTELRRVELVGQPLELALSRVGDGEETRERLFGEPGQLLRHAPGRSAVAAKCDVLDVRAVRLEDSLGGLGGRVDQLALLLLAPPPEAVRGGAALLVATLDEAGANLGSHEALALED